MNDQPVEKPTPDKKLARRTVVSGAAWSVPVIAATIAAPAHAASQPSGPICNGCFAWDPTHQNLAKPPADTWVTGPINNATDPATLGTVLVAYYSLKYVCTVPSDVRFISYLVTYDSHIQSSTSTTITTSDGGTVQPTYTPGGAVTIPGAGAPAVAGLIYGPNSGVPASSNVSALGLAFLYAGNVGWSANPQDLATGPSLVHHVTGAKFRANVQFTTVYMDGTQNTSSCTVPVTLTLTSPFPGSAATPDSYLYWYAGQLAGAIA